MEQLTEEMFNNVNHRTGDTRGCLRGKQCMYLHNLGKKGVNLKRNKSNHEREREREMFISVMQYSTGSDKNLYSQ